MTGDEIRASFLSFFERKGHKIIPSSSLIPQGDPTLLLTSAGMVQFKPYFLGEAVPSSNRLTSCQKCFRATDIESVGDTTHLTFFEMLGNFSIGDYFKQEAISWAWEFVTQELKMPADRLWITIFLDDDESFQYWRQVGVPEERILRFGEEDNFWGPAGDSGPCGPCSEIYYDFGEEFGCKLASCTPGCGCGRFSEIWNLVFTQYNQDKDGKRTLLPKPNIDTGMGLERTAAVMQAKTSVYETDLFTLLLERVAGLAGKGYGTDDDIDNAVRVIAEHSRGITFLIADGVMPGNEGSGYVLRRLLRRAALFGRRLGLDKPFLAETALTAIKQMGQIYPELAQREDFIIKVIKSEEERFSETLTTGLEVLEGIMAERETGHAGEISGVDAFRLSDTYGFPVELTKEIAAGRGFSVDIIGFDREMEKQRERARIVAELARCAECGIRLKDSDNKCPNCGSTKKAYGPIHFVREAAVQIGVNVKAAASAVHKVHSTTFVGYHDLKQSTTILSLLVDGNSVGTVPAGQEAGLILETTPFYSEMGGQVGDTGEIRSASGRFLVTNTVRVPPDITLHQGQVTEGSFTVGEEVEAGVDEERRRDIVRNHTATHLLQVALRQVLGEHVQQRGSLVAPERLRFDFSHLVAMTREETSEVQRIVNERIRQNLAVDYDDVPYKKAMAEGALALFGEKYGDVVRVLRIGRPPISIELCGGTHVASIGEIGFLHIITESSIGAGLRRIEAVTGRGAERYIGQRLSDLAQLAEYLDSDIEGVLDKTRSLSDELKQERQQTLTLERELAKKEVESLLGQAEVVKGINVLSVRVSSSNMQIMREMADFIREQLKSVIIILGAIKEDGVVFVASVTSDLQEKGYSAKDIINDISRVTRGGGGGRVDFAQAGGKDKDKLDEALRLVKSLI